MRIKEYREALGLSQLELAQRMNVCQSAVFRWEAGQTDPMAEKLPLLADLFGCSIDALYGRDAPVPARLP